MRRLLVCTAVYEAARRFITPWCDSVAAAASRYDGAVSVLLAVDDLTQPERTFAALSRRLPTHFADARGTGRIAAVRSKMLATAISFDTDAYVFLDIDDLAERQCFSAHGAALDEAEISYGDLRLIDEVGREVAPSFFADADVPPRVENARQLIGRNFIGFGNSALRAEAVSASTPTIPESVLAPDWWFFTEMLRNGRKARRTTETVGAYRLHGQSLLGGRASPEPGAVLRRCAIVLAHYRAFPDDPAMSRLVPRVETLMAQIERAPETLEGAMQAACGIAGLWFEDVHRLLYATEPAQSPSASATS